MLSLTSKAQLLTMSFCTIRPHCSKEMYIIIINTFKQSLKTYLFDNRSTVTLSNLYALYKKLWYVCVYVPYHNNPCNGPLTSTTPVSQYQKNIL